MTAKEVLFKHVPKNCYWEEGGNLDNCPLKYVIAAMEEYWWIKEPEMTSPDYSLKRFSLPNSEHEGAALKTDDEDKDHFAISFYVWLKGAEGSMYEATGISAYDLLLKYKDRPFIDTFNPSKQ